MLKLKYDDATDDVWKKGKTLLPDDVDNRWMNDCDSQPHRSIPYHVYSLTIDTSAVWNNPSALFLVQVGQVLRLCHLAQLIEWRRRSQLEKVNFFILQLLPLAGRDTWGSWRRLCGTYKLPQWIII